MRIGAGRGGNAQNDGSGECLLRAAREDVRERDLEASGTDPRARCSRCLQRAIEMSGRVRFSTIFAFLVVMSCLTSCYQGTRPPRIGKSALDFTIEDSDRKVSLRDLRGKVVVLNFWASWCPPCIEETPSLVRMQKRFKDKGVVVIGISADEDAAAYHAFIKKFDVSFVTVRDPSVKVQHLYGTVQIPESYIIDREGVLQRKIVNAIDWESPEITMFLTRTADLRR